MLCVEINKYLEHNHAANSFSLIQYVIAFRGSVDNDILVCLGFVVVLLGALGSLQSCLSTI